MGGSKRAKSIKDINDKSYKNKVDTISELIFNHYKNHYNGIYSNFIMKDLYLYEPLFQKIIDTLIADTLTPEWEYLNIKKDKKDNLKYFLQETSFIRELSTALLSERLYGGGILQIETNNSDISKPIKKGEIILGIKAIGIEDLTIQCTNVNYIDNNLKEYKYYINNLSEINISRLIFLRGKPYPILASWDRSNLSSDNQGIFSLPSFISIVPYFARMILVNENLNRLAGKSSILIFSRKDAMQESTSAGSQVSQALINILRSIDNNKSLLINGDASLMRVESTVIESLTNLKNSIMEDIANVINMPLIKFKGQGSGGLNSSDKQQLDIYASTIRYAQRNFLKFPILKYLKLLAPQFNINENIDIEFNPLYPPSELEKAQINQIKLQNILLLFDRQIITSNETRDELSSMGVTNNINYSEPLVDGNNFDYAKDENVDVQKEIKELKDKYSDDSNNVSE